MNIERPRYMPEDVELPRPNFTAPTATQPSKRPLWQEMGNADSLEEQEKIYQQILNASIQGNKHNIGSILAGISNTAMQKPSTPGVRSEQFNQEEDFIRRSQDTSEITDPEEKRKAIEERAANIPVVGEGAAAYRQHAESTAREKLKPVIRPEVKDMVDTAISTGFYGEERVLSHSTRPDGARVLTLENKETGRKYTIAEGFSETMNVYYVPDPPESVKDSTDEAEQWLNEQLRVFGEKSTTSPIDSQFYSDFTATIDKHFVNFTDADEPLMEDMDPTLAKKYRIEGTSKYETFKEKMIRRVQARITLHNASIQVRASLKEFGPVFNGLMLAREQATETLGEPGVKKAIELFDEPVRIVKEDPRGGPAEIKEDNQRGAFFRLGGGDADIQRGKIVAELQRNGLSELQAIVAVDLAEKWYHITGESSYYEAPKLKRDIQMKVRVRDPRSPGGAREVDYHLKAGQYALPPKDIFTEAPVANNDDNDHVQDPVQDFFATVFENHYDALDAGTFYNPASLSGQGISPLRQVFYSPMGWEQLGPNYGGKAEFLRRYGYMWRTSAVKTVGCESLGQLVDIDNDFKIFNNKNKPLRSWFGGVVTASENKDKLVGLFNKPLVAPNTMTLDNSGEGAKKAMSNFKKIADEVYTYMGSSGNHNAKAHLLKGVLKFIQERPESRRDPFGYRPLSPKAVHEIIVYAVGEGDLIESKHVSMLKDSVGNRTSLAVLQAAWPTFEEGVMAVIKKYLGAAFSTK